MYHPILHPLYIYRVYRERLNESCYNQLWSFLHQIFLHFSNQITDGGIDECKIPDLLFMATATSKRDSNDGLTCKFTH